MRAGDDLIIPPNNQSVEIFGVTVAEVNEHFQITSLETFYNPNQLFENMMKKIEEALPVGHGPVTASVEVVTTRGEAEEAAPIT